MRPEGGGTVVWKSQASEDYQFDINWYPVVPKLNMVTAWLSADFIAFPSSQNVFPLEHAYLLLEKKAVTEWLTELKETLQHNC